MPWPEIDGNTITTANGLVIEFVEPGRVARVSYASADGRNSFDVLATGVTPLLVRGHVMPGEEDHHGDPGRVPGGSEQFMHMTGELVLNGERHAVDCLLPARPLLASDPQGDPGRPSGAAGRLDARCTSARI